MSNKPTSGTSYLFLSCKKNFSSPFHFKSGVLPQSAIFLPSPIISLLHQGKRPSTNETNFKCGHSLCISKFQRLLLCSSLIMLPWYRLWPRGSGPCSVLNALDTAPVSVWVKESRYLPPSMFRPCWD